MLAATDDHKRLFVQGNLDEIGALVRGQFTNNEVNHAITQRFDQFAPTALQHLEAGREALRSHHRHRLRNEERPSPGRCSYADDWVVWIDTEFSERCMDLVQGEATAPGESPARKIHTDAAPPSLDELPFDGVFQISDGAMHRRLG
ncbi:hypothetical protein D3C87_1610750 [compost metagenome]